MVKVKNRRKNTSLKIVVTVAVVLLGALLFLQLRAKNAVEQFLERKIPAHIQLNYEDLAVNVLQGKVHFSDINIKLKDRDSTLVHTTIEAQDVIVNRLSYWEFFFKNTVKVAEVTLARPKVVHYASRTSTKEDDEPQGVVKLLKNIAIGKLAITNGSFDMTKKENDSLQVTAKNINFSLMNGRTDPEIIKLKIPLEYGTYEFSTEKIYVDLGDYESVTADTLIITEKDALLKNTTLKSKYSKVALSKAVRKEHDHIDLRIPEFRVLGIDFGFRGDQFFFSSRFGEIQNPEATIYRDKLVADDTSPKRMYSTMLREVPIQIAIDSVAMTNGKFRYEENSTYETKAGSLIFNELNLFLYNVSNTSPKNTKTLARLKGNLMGVAPLTMEYSFDMKDSYDAFSLNATLFNFNGEKVNSFLRPNLNAQIQGTVNELYFSVYGNAATAKGDMKMKYENLEFEILKKDRLRINKLLSAIGNLFVNDGSDADANGYRYGTIDVERDPEKSFFNYVWIITQDGLLSTLTGDGKKEGK